MKSPKITSPVVWGIFCYSKKKWPKQLNAAVSIISTKNFVNDNVLHLYVNVPFITSFIRKKSYIMVSVMSIGKNQKTKAYGANVR